MTALPPIDEREADRLFARLLELPPGGRHAALDAACDDEALRSAVRRLLREAEAPDDSFDPGTARGRRLWQGLALETEERESPVASGAMMGPYQIVEEIERGGMAVVYRAERVDGELTREVAVKILKLGLDTEEVVRRFEQERQILADLDHPNIARVYDAGRTDDGRPYFVMELVEGVPIDRYCDEHRLSIDERLELFCVVAGAVDSAHQHLVVHRDLKPSNILVSRHGEVKLLDFGIARLLDVETGGRAAPPTRALVRMMTPEYASPEQVRGERVTTASDVYQLGLLLYELLTGHRPYTVSDSSSGALERAICEQVPTRPSAAALREETAKGPADVAAAAPHLKRPTSVSARVDRARHPERPEGAPSPRTGATAVERICRVRSTSPTRLRRRLRGDLDNIVLRALRKEPERRYRGTDRLAQDIRRHLDGLPVTARSDTWLYRGRKFLARHAIGATATALALISAAGVAGFHTARIRGERDRAEAALDQAETERRRAQEEATKAEQMNQFLAGLFRSVDPREALGAEVTAGELLDRGVEQVNRELAGSPTVQADMLHVLGRTYLELGVYDSADRLLSRALQLRRGRLSPDRLEVGKILGDIGRLRALQGEYNESRELLEEAMHILGASSGGDAPDFARVLIALGVTYRDLGQPGKGLEVLKRALALQRRTTGETSETVAMILHGMGAIYSDMGGLEEADNAYERALARYERELGADHPQVASVLMNLANIRVRQGELDDLEAIYRRNLDIQKGAYGPHHTRVATALDNLGDLLFRLRRYDEAVDVLQQALDIYATAVGLDHPTVAYPLATLGDIHLAAGRPREARELYQRVLTVRRPAESVDRVDLALAHSLSMLGRAEADLGNWVAAEESWNRALAIWREAPEAVDPQLAASLFDLGRGLVELRRCVDGVPLLQRVVQIEAGQRAPLPFTAEAERLLAECGAAGVREASD